MSKYIFSFGNKEKHNIYNQEGCLELNLYKDINSIEKKYDKHKKWRKYYNNKLKTTYDDVFNLFDYGKYHFFILTSINGLFLYCNVFIL